MDRKPQQGEFCWSELATDNVDVCREFYRKVFDWVMHPSQNAGAHGMEYQEFGHKGENPMGGLYDMKQVFPAESAPPPHWVNYIAVDDIDEACARVEGLGGKRCHAPKEIPHVGRMVTITDPTGAMVIMLTLRQAQEIGMAEFTIPKHGTICWRELQTKDLAAAKAFYEALIGWEMEDSTLIGADYPEIHVGGRAIGGMMEVNSTFGEGWEKIPAHWGIYIAVDDCDAAYAAVKATGGNVHVPPFDAPNVGRVCSE